MQHLNVIRNRLADNIDEADLDIMRSKANAVADIIETEEDAREDGRPSPSSWETSPEADALVLWWASISDGRTISPKEALRSNPHDDHRPGFREYAPMRSSERSA